MRVLQVLNTGKYSGAENVVITLIQSLDGKVECAYTSPDGPIKEILKNENIDYYPMNSRSVTVRELKRVIDDFRPDLIHTHDFKAGIMTCLTGTKIPIVNHLHNNTPWIKKVCQKSLAYFVSCAKYRKILTVSDSVMDEFIFGNTVKKKSVVVGNPINIRKIEENASKNGALCETSDVIFLGRLSFQKKPLFFLDILREIVKEKPDLKVAMVGSGELYEEVTGKISENGLENNVKLYGFQKNPYGILKAARVMCMPSEWEGFGLAAVEALTLGVPVVCSGAGGLKNIINDDCGKICHTKEEYVEEIKRLLSDDEYLKKKNAGAIERARDFDNLQTYSNVILNTYIEVLKGEM